MEIKAYVKCLASKFVIQYNTRYIIRRKLIKKLRIEVYLHKKSKAFDRLKYTE